MRGWSSFCPVTADQRGDKSASGQACDAGAVQLVQQVISFTQPAHGTIGGSATLLATGGASGNPVVFKVASSSGPGVCSVSGTTVNYLQVGKCAIAATQAGNANYLAAKKVTKAVNVSS
jgi:trimeric autotransporter adhesin